MRLLLLLILIGAVAYFTVPTRETQEAAARAFMEAEAQEQTGEVQAQTGISLDSVVDFVTGFVAGQGRYENYYVASKFTADMPGAAYLECWGAFTQVQCRRVDRGAGQT
ncbi:MAG: hypothetical protein KF779_07445 [Hyphomonadaceae bacterium]|nr:hypothetical protein [Hyphomonadaceae bacterium]